MNRLWILSILLWDLNSFSIPAVSFTVEFVWECLKNLLVGYLFESREKENDNVGEMLGAIVTEFKKFLGIGLDTSVMID